MEIHFPPDLEAKLANSAAKQGRNPDELLRDVVAQYLEDEDRFVEAVNAAMMPCGAATISLITRSVSD
jgi:hypothetical protein